MQDLKLTNQISGHENARHENAGPENDRIYIILHSVKTLKVLCQNLLLSVANNVK